MEPSNVTSQTALAELKAQYFEREISFRHGPRVAPLAGGPVKKDKLGFEYAEHGFLGDNITLRLDNKTNTASTVPLLLPNGLLATYGQINGLAGDFYGTTDPISDGVTFQDQCDRFSAAWAMLAVDGTRQPGEALALLEILDLEVKTINNALANHVDPSTAYATLPDQTMQFEQLTLARPINEPSYLGLSKINWDHFGDDARTAYDAGHTVAIQEALKGNDQQSLHNAYAINAFADHFLEDSFSAGHTRTPRRQLHSLSGDADLCAKLMHDEDNAIGLSATNPNGTSWTMYGDKRLLDEVNEENKILCLQAIQASADEIYKAWSTQKMPQVNTYVAWNYAPTLVSTRANTQLLAPLFTFDQQPQRRADIKNRRDWNFASEFWYSTTALACKTSGLWNYPITLGGIQKVSGADLKAISIGIKETPDASGIVGLTDADMTVINDYPQSITVTVDNNQHMSNEFPSPVSIPPGASSAGYVKASNWPAQSSFEITFQSGDKMSIDIGTGAFSTGASPEYFSSGKAAAILAPGTPFSTDSDFHFWFFNGPGILPPLINSAIQANLPAIISYIASNPMTIKISDGVSLEITSLNLDPATVQCTYAAILPKSNTNGDLCNLNVILRVGNGELVGSETIKGQTGSIDLSVTDCMLFVQAQVDLTFQTQPMVTALQCSLGDYSLGGGIVDILKAMFPVVAQLYALGASAYRVAGAINTVFNQALIAAINSAIHNAIPTSDVAVHPAWSLANGIRFVSSIVSQPRLKTVKLSPLSVGAGLSTWMSTPQIQAKTLGQLKIPGTHDSATYALAPVLSQIVYPDIQFLWYLSNQTAPANGQWPLANPPTAANPLYLGNDLCAYVLGPGANSISRSQDMTILQQLLSGIRYFDFRVYFDTRDNTFYTQHAVQGPTFQSCLLQILTFIVSNSSSTELIFVSISHTNFKDFPDQIPRLTSMIKSLFAIPDPNVPQYLYYQATPSGKTQFDFQTLASTTLSTITAGTPKVMFLNGDLPTDGTVPDYTYPDTVTNSLGYAGVPWGGELTTVNDLIAREGPGLENHQEPLWSVSWVLGADVSTMIQTNLSLLAGVEKWALQTMATQANAALGGFLNLSGGASAKFNLVTVDWLEYGSSPSVPEIIIGMNS